MYTLGIDAFSSKKEKSGVEWYTYYLLREMKKITPKDWRVFLYSAGDDDFTKDISNDAWQWKKLSWPIGRGWGQARLSIEMALKSPNVLFVPGAIIPFIHPHSFRSKKYTVTTIHDIGFLENPELYDLEDKKRQEFAFDFAVRHAAKIFSPSEATKQAIKKYSETSDVVASDPRQSKDWRGERGNLLNEHRLLRRFTPRNDNVIGDKILVTPLGVNHETYKLLPRELQNIELLEKYGIKAPFAFYLGRIDKKKNLENLVKAFSIFKNNVGKDFSLILAGSSGFGSDDVVQKIVELGLEDSVKILGFVDEKDVPQILGQASFFVFPSAYEGFGLPLLQAMAIGTPVIASDIPALREVGGDAAIFVDSKNPERFAEAMSRLASDENLRKELRDKGNEQSKKFSWESCATKTWQGIVDLVSR